MSPSNGQAGGTSRIPLGRALEVESTGHHSSGLIDTRSASGRGRGDLPQVLGLHLRLARRLRRRFGDLSQCGKDEAGDEGAKKDRSGGPNRQRVIDLQTWTHPRNGGGKLPAYVWYILTAPMMPRTNRTHAVAMSRKLITEVGFCMG